MCSYDNQIYYGDIMKSIKLAVLGLAVALSAGLAHADTRVLKKVPPEFPAAATKKGINEGKVRMGLTIDANGNVVDAKLLEAAPSNAKIFNEAATEALKKWKFESTGTNQTYEVQLVFKTED